MKDHSASPAAQRHLNPFLFPSETTYRFILLLVALSGANLFLYHWLYLRVPPLKGDLDLAIVQCTEWLRNAPPPPPGQDRLISTDCTTPTFRQQALFALAGLGLTLIITVLIYWIYPNFVIRRHNLKPLSVADAPGLPEALHQLCREVGLRRAPTFLIDPRNDGDGGIAFGRSGRYYVRLDAGLVLKFWTDRPIFDAVVRHELAHIRNADVSMTYLALIGWWVFLVSAVAVFAYDLIVWLTDTLTMFAWRFALILLLVYWARNAILRVRELYADARAHQSDAGSGALARVFERGAEGHNWLDRLFGVHPATELRRAALENPACLFRLSLSEAVAAGVATGIGLPMVAFIVGQLYVPGTSLWVPLLGLLFFVPFLVGGLGLGVWRQNYASVMLHERSTDAGQVGIFVGMGFLVGVQISPLPFMPSDDFFQITAGHRALTAAAMLLFLFLVFRWIAACANAWVEAASGAAPLRFACSCGLIIATLLMASGCYWLWQFGTTLPGLANAYRVPLLTLIIDPSIVIPYLQGLLITVFLICIWTFPLVADWLVQLNATRRSFHAIPVGAKHHEAWREVRAALLGALFSALVVLVLYMALRLAFFSTLRTDSEEILLYANLVLIVGVAQACLAASISWRSRRLSAFYGLCAAFVAGCLMATGFLIIFSLMLGRFPDQNFVWMVFTNFVNLGALFALPLVLVASIRLWPTRVSTNLPRPRTEAS